MANQFTTRLQQTADTVSNELDQLLHQSALYGETFRPPRLIAAIRHGVLNGGKRLRPLLLIETAALFCHRGAGVVRAACALECLHCYSLIHDDLPCMDDDDLRRGEPTVHRAFDEATAVLAGDALLTLAFDILSRPEISDNANIRAELVQMLARAAGLGGMIGGQALDMTAEIDDPDETEILRLQAMKTGALIRFACEAGAVLAGAAPDERLLLARFGSTIGEAFQLADDILDVTATSDAMGKATGKDADRGKKTLLDIYGIDGARERLDQLAEKAIEQLSPFGKRAKILRDTARLIVERTS